MTGKTLLAVAALPFTALSIQSQSTDASRVMDRAESWYQSVMTITAHFDQLIINPMLGEPEPSSGTLYLQRPGLFAMDFEEPEGDRIVVDGEWLWLYTPNAVPDQVIRQPIPATGSTTPNIFAQFVENADAKYTATHRGTDVIEGDQVDLVHLVPRGSDTPFRRATVAVSRRDGALRRVEFTEESGQDRSLTFSRIRVDESIPARHFSFEVPRGTRIVEP